MPPRDQSLPEGTDKVVAGASKTDTSGSGSTKSGGSRESSGGFVASGGGNDTGGTSGGGGALSTDRIVSQVRDQVSNLREQGVGKAREYAEGGKDRTTQLLDDLSEIIHDAARSIDDRLGDQYGEYAHKAGDAVASLAGNLRDKSIEDLIDGTRSIVRKSPAVTVGTAALLGFVLVRLVKSGLEGSSGGGNTAGSSSGRSGGSGSGSGD